MHLESCSNAESSYVTTKLDHLLSFNQPYSSSHDEYPLLFLHPTFQLDEAFWSQYTFFRLVQPAAGYQPEKLPIYSVKVNSLESKTAEFIAVTSLTIELQLVKTGPFFSKRRFLNY